MWKQHKGGRKKNNNNKAKQSMDAGHKDWTLEERKWLQPSVSTKSECEKTPLFLEGALIWSSPNNKQGLLGKKKKKKWKVLHYFYVPIVFIMCCSTTALFPNPDSTSLRSLNRCANLICNFTALHLFHCMLTSPIVLFSGSGFHSSSLWLQVEASVGFHSEVTGRSWFWLSGVKPTNPWSQTQANS